MATDMTPVSGRNAEREILARLLDSPKPEFLAIFGRRRVGKTFLVRRFFDAAPVTYFEVVGRHEGSVGDHLRMFADSVRRIAQPRLGPASNGPTEHRGPRFVRILGERGPHRHVRRTAPFSRASAAGPIGGRFTEAPKKR